MSDSGSFASLCGALAQINFDSFSSSMLEQKDLEFPVFEFEELMISPLKKEQFKSTFKIDQNFQAEKVETKRKKEVLVVKCEKMPTQKTRDSLCTDVIKRRKRICIPAVSCRYHGIKINVQWTTPCFVEEKHLLIYPFQEFSRIKNLCERYSQDAVMKIAEKPQLISGGKIFKSGYRKQKKSIYLSQISERTNLKEYSLFMLEQFFKKALSQADRSKFTTIVIPEIYIHKIKTEVIIERIFTILFALIRKKPLRHIRHILLANYSKDYYEIAADALSQINRQYFNVQD